MSVLTLSIEIEAPRETVFAAAADPHAWSERMSQIQRVEVLTEGPVRVGTKFRETRVMFGKEASETMEFVELDAPHHYAIAATSCGVRYHSRFQFQQTPSGGTRVDLAFQGTPTSLSARCLNWLMAPLMKGTMIKCMRQDLDDLKDSLERAQATAAI